MDGGGERKVRPGGEGGHTFFWNSPKHAALRRKSKD
jgi:hypothetical protein